LTLESNKTLGGIGAIMLFIGVIPFVQYIWVIGIVGAILTLVALRGLANYYKEGGIFSNALYGVAIIIVGGIITGILAFAVVLSNLRDLLMQLYPGWNGVDWSALQGMTPNTNIDPSAVFPLIGGLLVVLVIVWVFVIIASFMIYRSLKQLSNKSNVGLFGTAGLLLLIGAIIPLIGLILMWIAALLLAIAFFTMKTSEPPTAVSDLPPPTTV
jgi:uncharacterized membrane protein